MTDIDNDDFFKPLETPNTIKVSIRDIYGRQSAYPVCDKAKLFAKLAGTTTLTHNTLELIKQLGYTIEVEPRTL